MIQYIENIIHPHIEGVRDRIDSHDAAALVIMDNFKGQTSQRVTHRLSLYNIHTCYLPPNTTDRLQPLDVSVNKPAKDFLRRKFDDWYSQQVINQLNGKSDEEIEDFQLPPIDLSMARMKEVCAEWFVQMAEYIAENPSFLVNGFIASGITGAIDGIAASDSEDELQDNLTDEESMDEEQSIDENELMDDT